MGAVRLSPEAFTPGSGRKDEAAFQPSPDVQAKVAAQLAGVDNAELREALRTLGHALSSKAERNSG